MKTLTFETHRIKFVKNRSSEKIWINEGFAFDDPECQHDIERARAYYDKNKESIENDE